MLTGIARWYFGLARIWRTNTLITWLFERATGSLKAVRHGGAEGWEGGRGRLNYDGMGTSVGDYGCIQQGNGASYSSVFL
jgi:hypothetical protein